MSFKRLAIHRRVIVNLTSGTAFAGLLWDERNGVVVIRAASLLEPGRPPVPVDGDVLVELSRVDYVQVLPVGAA